MFAQPLARPRWLSTFAPRRNARPVVTARITAAADLVEATVLYVAFPDAVRRWDADEAGTAALVARTWDSVAAAVAAHGGTPVPAHLDARSAVFPSAAAAFSAAVAVAHAAAEPGALPAAIGLASAHIAAGPFSAWELHGRARAVAEVAGEKGFVLADSTAERLPSAQAVGVGLRAL